MFGGINVVESIHLYSDRLCSMWRKRKEINIFISYFFHTKIPSRSFLSSFLSIFSAASGTGLIPYFYLYLYLTQQQTKHVPNVFKIYLDFSFVSFLLSVSYFCLLSCRCRCWSFFCNT